MIEWSSLKFTWEYFRTKVIGTCNPAKADPESLRGNIYSKWLDFKLLTSPDLKNNAIHAPSSAFESLIERSIWFMSPLESDIGLGQKLIAAGIPLQILKEWSFNPKIVDTYVFDSMYNLDSEHCILKAKELLKLYAGMYVF
jgi:hypothetical protein